MTYSVPLSFPQQADGFEGSLLLLAFSRSGVAVNDQIPELAERRDFTEHDIFEYIAFADGIVKELLLRR